MLFWDIDGAGSQFARATPRGNELDATGVRRVARFGGILWTVIALGWTLFGGAMLVSRVLS